MGSNVGINIKRIEWGLWTHLIWLISVTRGWGLARVNTVMNLRVTQYARILLTKNPAVSFTEKILSQEATNFVLNENYTRKILESLAH
jgi:hypothetical protein